MTANPSLARHPALDDWLSIGTDGRITIRTGKVDIGQRISTALALIAADELDVDRDRIAMERPETGVAPDEGITSGSNSMMESGQAVRLAAATARRHLLSLAATELDADIASLEVADGLVRSRTTNRSITYGDLAGGASFGIPVDIDARVKPPSEYRHVGVRVVPSNMDALIDGTARFVHDMTMPGMVHARVVRPPHYHAHLEGLDKSILERLEGADIRVVRNGSFLAVAGTDEYAATKGCGACRRGGGLADGRRARPGGPV